jgi:hypothetical protein
MGVCKTKRNPEPVGVTYVRHLSEIAIGIIAVAALAALGFGDYVQDDQACCIS